MRNYEATITDRDGEEHSYRFISRDPWTVTAVIAKHMRAAGDFYGHEASETQNVSVHELVAGADMRNAVGV